uniref:Uncharacterized protein n=1 Tax=Amphilophus citrinellus TaxID=61819 RepID=A0A3Q0SG46_AMPCI
SMAAHVTPPPLAHTAAETTTLFPDLVTKIGAKGIISVVLLLMICVIGVLMWCLSRQKGDYVTNETDEKDEDVDSGDGESVGSDAELQSKEPLKAKEEE